MSKRVKVRRTQISRARALDVAAKSAHPEVKALAPSWTLVMGYRHGAISQQEYTAQYLNQLEGMLVSVWR